MVTRKVDNGTGPTTKRCSNSKEMVILFPQPQVLGIEACSNKEEAEVPFTFNGDFMITELWFQTLNSVNLSQYLRGCYELVLQINLLC